MMLESGRRSASFAMPSPLAESLQPKPDSPLPDLRLRLWHATLHHHPRGILVSTAAALGISIVLADVATPLYWLWLSSVLAFSVLRFALYLHCQADLQRSAARSRWRSLRHWHDAAMVLAGLQWAALAWWGIPHFSGAAQFTILIILSALAGGATASLAALPHTGKVFIALALLPACVQLFLQQHPGDLTLGTLGLVFAWVMISGHSSNHQILVHSLRLAEEKEGLVDALSHKTQEILRANAELEARVADRTQALRYEAEHDALTGLLNRRGLRAHALPAEKGEGLATLVALVDLDRFKEINDSLGHDWGDSVLQAVARRLHESASTQANACAISTFAASRWGGDEFVLWAQGSPAAIAAMQAGLETLRTRLAQPYRMVDRSLNPGASLGYVSFAAQEAPELLQAIRLADLAVSEAKRQGRNRCVEMTPALMNAHERRSHLSEALRTATFDGSLSLVFQPIVSSRTHAILAYETLLRWHCPGLGPVSPVEFIPLAEEINQIEPIGEWVLRAGCREAASWLADEYGLVPQIAINASLKQLLNPAFAARVGECLQESGLAPSRLVVEVTESVFNDSDFDTVLATLRSLRQAGVDIHVDDFGTGYSSLSRLHEFPLTAVKVDKCFVHSGDERALAVIEGTLLIARRFGLRVIAEGVETEAQATALCEIGVDELQGYFFGRPGSIDPRHRAPADTL